MKYREFFAKTESQALKKAASLLGMNPELIRYVPITNLANRPDRKGYVGILVEVEDDFPPDDGRQEACSGAETAAGSFDEAEKRAYSEGGAKWACAFCSGILKRMGIDAEVELAGRYEDLGWEVIRVTPRNWNPDLKRGVWREFRGALQHLVNRSVNTGDEGTRQFIIDMGDTLEGRMKEMARLSDFLAGKISQLGLGMEIHLVDSQDRRILHSRLSGTQGVVTEAAGSKRFRVLKIRPGKAGKK
ncbi:MAG: hypothetical protein D6806_04045 [Deltaproteobacteria bacterium]|nr:MAG: hypothetical protein D6806_04045 [Deltaproteobacteria bacterium]